MAEWRYLHGWSEAGLAKRLERARALPPNFSLDEEMSPRRGWNVTMSRAWIAREKPGPPEPDGPFERLWRGLQRFDHSDPRIVVVHFPRHAAVLDRSQLLELKALGLRYLCPARIGAIRDETSATDTWRGIALDTLDGHIERGREWFLLWKNHRTGDVRFRIEAVWRPGDFPNFWSRLGFRLVGRHYQRAWHRLCHLRLRRIAAGLALDERIATPHWMATEPIHLLAQRGWGRQEADVEREEEDVRTDRLWRAAGLGALSGVRSLGGPAVLASALERRGKSFLSGTRLPIGLGKPLAVLAGAEMIADKLPVTPPRTRPLSLAARAASGALAGSAAARKRESKWAPALVGAGAALVATFGSYWLRRAASRRSRILGNVVAVAEDALVLWSSRRLAGATTRATRAIGAGA